LSAKIHFIELYSLSKNKTEERASVTQSRIPVSAWIYLSIAIITLVETFVDLPALTLAAAALIILFIVLEIPFISRAQLATGGVLIGLGLIGAAISGQWEEVVIGGVARSKTFLLLFFAVSWLQHPAGESPSLRAARKTIVSQPPGRRYLYLSFGVHGLGAVLNLAGLSLLSSVVEGQKDPRLKRRLTVALMQGFTSASCWSPFYVGMVVILVALPTLTWRDVGPLGMGLAVIIILSGWAYDRLIVRGGSSARQVVKPVLLARGDLGRVIVILGLLAVLVLISVEGVGFSIPVALGLIGPPFAMAWAAAMATRDSNRAARAKQLANKVMHWLPTLRSEALVFVGANILGVGVAGAVPAENIGEVVNDLLPDADVKILAMIIGFMISGLIGLHPVVVVILASAILPPEVLGLQDWIVGLTYLGCWGLATLISPFSATTLFMSRVTGVPSPMIAWRWTPAPVFVAAILIGIYVISIRHLSLSIN
jgi:hypothetical protein